MVTACLILSSNKSSLIVMRMNPGIQQKLRRQIIAFFCMQKGILTDWTTG